MVGYFSVWMFLVLGLDVGDMFGKFAFLKVCSVCVCLEINITC